MPTGFLVSLNVQVVFCGVSTVPGGGIPPPPRFHPLVTALISEDLNLAQPQRLK